MKLIVIYITNIATVQNIYKVALMLASMVFIIGIIMLFLTL